MTKCFICKEEIFLKEYEEEINGKKRKVCGKCCDRVCYLCGKSKRKDGITKFSYEKIPETGEYVYIGCCCTFVAGRMDMFKLYSEKYNNMKKNDPVTLAKIMEHSEEQRIKRAAALTDPREAEKLIDHWSSRQKKNKERTGKSRKKGN
jgi:hypothetical protein